MRIEIGLALSLMLSASPLLAAGQSVAPGKTTTFQVVPLVSDQPGIAPNTDPDLVNPWGLSQFPGAPVWVSDNGTNKSTLYDPNTGAKSSLVVNIPHGSPTGTVAVPSGAGFVIKKKGKSADSSFLFDTESGQIEGWSSSVDLNNAVVAFNGSGDGSVYKGLAIDTVGNQIYAADFANNQVEVFDNAFHKVGAFTDPNLPKNYAPFNVAVLNGKLYVAFAKREKHGIDEVDGAGLGYVDVFGTDGTLQQHLVANGPLNAPWGLALAPANFGTFAGALLVGNFGNGEINAFDPATGTLIGTLSSGKHKALKIEGLWALDDTGNNAITFSAGPGGEAHGLFGLIEPK